MRPVEHRAEGDFFETFGMIQAWEFVAIFLICNIVAIVICIGVAFCKRTSNSNAEEEEHSLCLSGSSYYCPCGDSDYDMECSKMRLSSSSSSDTTDSESREATNNE